MTLTKLFRLQPMRGLHCTAAAKDKGPVTFDEYKIRDFKAPPVPAPLTPEEHRIAAMRFGMRPEDYKSYDPERLGQAVGDYPDLGIITYAHKDPYEAWSDRHFRRNWGEPVPFKIQFYRPDRTTFTNLEDPETDHMNLRSFMKGFGALVFILVSFVAYQRSSLSVDYCTLTMPKQYAYDFHRAWPWNDPQRYPIVNYSFEPANAEDDEGHH